MKLIPLTQGQFAMVDDDDFDMLNEFKWHALKAPRTWYAGTNVGKKSNRTSLRMHCFLMCSLSGVDHIDRNGLCNMKHNLRLATEVQNHANQAKTTRPTSSIYKGVSLKRETGKWRAYIGSQSTGGIKNIGYFSSEKEAAVAYDSWAVKIYGEFARLNFPCP